MYLSGTEFVSRYKASMGVLECAESRPLSKASSTFSKTEMSLLLMLCQASELNSVPLTSMACLRRSPALILQWENGISFTIAKMLFTIP